MGRLTLFGAAAFFTSMLLTTSAAAGCLCGRWANNPAPLNVCVKVNDSGCADSALDAPVREAISRWNVFAPQWAFVDPPVDVNGPRDGRNSLTFQTRAQVAARWGVAIPQNVLGVTFLFPVVGGPVGNQACPLPGGIRCPTFGDAADHDVDIVLLSEQRFTLDEERVYESFYGRLQPAEFGLAQVVMHEVGHAHGQMHESRFPSIMHPSQIPFRGVTLLSDDVAAFRAHRAAEATPVDDLAVVAFDFVNGAYRDAIVSPAPPAMVRAGQDSIRVSRLSVFNRADQQRGPLEVTVRIGGIIGGRFGCQNTPANGVCTFAMEEVVPVSALTPGGLQSVTAEVEGYALEPLQGDNRVRLGSVVIVAAVVVPDAEVDAVVVDAEVDAAAVDAEVDAAVVDAKVDAAVVDAKVDVAVVDAKVDVTTVDAATLDGHLDAAALDGEAPPNPDLRPPSDGAFADVVLPLARDSSALADVALPPALDATKPADATAALGEDGPVMADARIPPAVSAPSLASGRPLDATPLAPWAGCSCAATDTPGPSLGVVATLLALAARRRRHPR